MKTLKTIISDMERPYSWMRSDVSSRQMDAMPKNAIRGLVTDCWTLSVTDTAAFSDLLGVDERIAKHFGEKVIARRHYGKKLADTNECFHAPIQFWSRGQLEEWILGELKEFTTLTTQAQYTDGLQDGCHGFRSFARQHELVETFIKLLESGAITISHFQVVAYMSTTDAHYITEDFKYYWDARE